MTEASAKSGAKAETAGRTRPPGGSAQLRREFEAIALPHLDGLYAVGLRLTRSPRDAEDLVQESLLRAYRFFDRFEPGTNAKAWLTTVLTNTFINLYRRRTKERELLDAASAAGAPPELAATPAPRTDGDPERVLFDRLLSGEVLAAIDRLPTDFRMAVILADLQELSYKEVAEAMSCPVGTVMSRLFRGRRLLQAALAEVGRAQGLRGAGATGTDNVLELKRRGR